MNQSLNILDLKGNALCDQGMFQLCQGLRHNVGLSQLNVSQNGFSAFGVEFLKDALTSNAKNGIHVLDISFNTIETHGVTHLSSLLQHENTKLRKLNVEGCGIQGQHALNFFRGIKKCPSLRQLRADKNDFSNPTLRRAVTTALGNTLQQIFCEYCMLGTAGAINVTKAIEQNKQITVVSLKGNSIEYRAAVPLKLLLPTRSLHLEVLDLSENLLHDDGGKLIAEGLEKNESLKKLYMQSNSLEKASGRAFRHAVERNKVILTLNLADNHIDLGLLVEIKARLDRNRDAVSGQEIVDMRKEEREIERDKNHYKTETKSQLIREKRGLNKKKRQVREEERRLRVDVAELVAHNEREQAKLDALIAVEAEIDDSRELAKLKKKEQELARAQDLETNRRGLEKERMIAAQEELKQELEEFKAKLEEMRALDEEYKAVEAERRRAFTELIAAQEEYAANNELLNSTAAPREPRESEPVPKAPAKGKGAAKASTGGASTPAEKGGKAAKGKRDGKKK